jgi:hypothetical protein
VLDLIERGTGAQRQLAVWRAERDLRTLMRELVHAAALPVSGQVAGADTTAGA